MENSQRIQSEIDEFVADLFREDEMGAVIRAHIRIENLLLQLVQNLTPKPTHLKKLNLDFDGLVTIALAHGLKDHFGPPFRTLGKLRNDFAHKLDTHLNKTAVRNLYSALSTEEKDHVQESFHRIKADHESTRHVKRFTDLAPGDQFKLIAVTLWAVLRAAVLNHPGRSRGA